MELRTKNKRFIWEKGIKKTALKARLSIRFGVNYANAALA